MKCTQCLCDSHCACMLHALPSHCQDGCMDEERVSELCQTYSERFSIEPSQIMDTMRVICKAADPKVSFHCYAVGPVFFIGKSVCCHAKYIHTRVSFKN